MNNEHDIVIEFGTSLDSKGNFKQYEVANGSVFNFDYSETLDSATILIPHVALENRLWNIKPYDFVRVYDKLSGTDPNRPGRYKFDKNYLIDSFNEQEENIEEHIFTYTINLMSETKLLEKIQCPNLTITHNINDDGTTTKKTIYDYLNQYLELYCPKAKINNGDGTWSYQQIINLPKVDDIKIRNDYQNGYIEKVSDKLFTVNSDFLYNLESLTLTVYTHRRYVPVDVIEWYITVTNNTNEILTIPSGTLYAYTSELRQMIGMTLRFPVEQRLEQNVVINPGQTRALSGEGPGGAIATQFLSIDNAFNLNEQYNFGLLGGTMNYRGSDITPSDPPSYNVEYKIKTQYGTDNSFFDRFNVTAADMVFTAPTLRQLFTLLMEQVGCIPVIENRTLSYLDFRAEPDSFAISGDDYTVNHTVSKISRSLSSDSYVNTLVSMDSQLLDDNNIVINEVIGFRDRNNIFLKQKSNLILETRYPIYKVEKFGINVPMQANNMYVMEYTWQEMWPKEFFNGWFKREDNQYPYNGQLYPSIYTGVASKDYSEINYIKVFVKTGESGSQYSQTYTTLTVSMNDDNELFPNGIDYNGHHYSFLGIKWKNAKISFYRKDWTTNTQDGYKPGILVKVAEKIITGEHCNTLENFNITDLNLSSARGTNFHNYVDVMIFEAESLEPVIGRFLDSSHQQYEFVTYPEWSEIYNQYGTHCIMPLFIHDGYSRFFPTAKVNSEWSSLDITPLVKENSERYLLSTNFIEMSEASTVDELSRYIYGTVGYYQNSKNIFGFSETYITGSSSAVGWIQSDYTYIENIINFFSENNLEQQFTYDKKQLSYYVVENDTYILPVQIPSKPNEDETYTFDFFIENYALLSFDVTYKPINSVNLSYVKTREDVPYALEQYSSSASGLSDLDRVSTTQQEQVDRVGNETLTITQVTRNFGNIRSFDDGNGGQRPLLFKDDLNRDKDYADTGEDIEYTIYRMSYAIKNYKYDVSYVGSKDAILKNYFTSIRTKYRAYQNVNYEQATTRKEKDVVFVRIGEDYYDGDDKIKFFNESTKSIFFCVDVNSSDKINVLYTKTQDSAYAFKNEISIMSTKNMFSLNYEEFDNVSPGIYLDTNITSYNAFVPENGMLGGIPQGWYLFDSLYSPNTQIIFSSRSPYTFFAPVELFWEKFLFPKVNAFEEYNSNPSDYGLFTVCSDNNVDTSVCSRLFYKDVSEIINYTLEFIYYSTSENVKWTENFIKGNGLIQTAIPNALIPGPEQNLSDFIKEEEYVVDRDDIQDLQLYLSNYITVGQNSDGAAYIDIDWAGMESGYDTPLGFDIDVVKIISTKLSGGDDVICNDFIAFKRPKDSEGHYVNVSRFYLTLNDTKSDFVLSERNGILYKSHKVALNTMGRNVLPENAIWYREDDDND